MGSTSTTTLSGPSARDSNTMLTSVQAAAECRNNIFNATLPGKWPLKPMLVPGVFGKQSRPHRRAKAQERGNPSLMHQQQPTTSND